MELYLKPTYFIDADHPEVIAFAEKHIQGKENATERAIALYYAVRDGFRYNPHDPDIRHESLKASHLLNRVKQEGYCIEKACLLAACGRVVGIPTRLGFGNVRNHIGTGKLEKSLGTNLLVFHGYTEFFLEGKWVKATPAFNKSLCERLNVSPLEFDGQTDSVFQEYNRGKAYMVFEHDYGQFHDVPHDLFVQELLRHYPHLFPREKMAAAGLGWAYDYLKKEFG